VPTWAFLLILGTLAGIVGFRAVLAGVLKSGKILLLFVLAALAFLGLAGIYVVIHHAGP